LQQLHQVRDEADPQHRPGPGVAHGTLTHWLEGCDCDPCRLAMNAATKARGQSRTRLVVPPAVSDYQADDEHNSGDDCDGDHEQYSPTCESHDVSFDQSR
jgi:hypothetical protein